MLVAMGLQAMVARQGMSAWHTRDNGLTQNKRHLR